MPSTTPTTDSSNTSTTDSSDTSTTTTVQTTIANSSTTIQPNANIPVVNSFAFFNVQGLCPQTVPSKVPFIKDNVCNENQLFVGLSETWLHNHKEAELKVEGFTLFRCDSTRKKKSRGRFTGGVCFYVRDDIAASCETIYSHSSSSVQLLCLYSTIENLAILVVYRQPDDKANGNPSTSNDFIIPINGVKNALSKLETVPNIIFGGDFNLPKATWPEGLPKSGCTINDRLILNSLNQFCNEFFMSQYIDSPTHKDGNALDLVFTNNEQIIHSYTTVPVLQSTSHHDIVLVSTTLKIQNYLLDNDQQEPRTKFNTLNFFADNIDWETIKNDLKNVNWQSEFDTEDPDVILETFNNICYRICESRVPMKAKTTSKTKPKAERYRHSLIKRRRKITKKLLHTNSKSKKDKIKDELLQIEKKLQKSFNESKRHVESKVIDSIKKNSKYFFTYAKKKSKIRSNIGPLLNCNGELTQRSKEMADILADQYAKVFSKPKQPQPQPNQEKTNKVKIDEINITEDSIVKAINELSPSSSAGPDGFPAMLLKKCKDELSFPLCLLWKKSLEIGLVPTELKNCTITPIHKGGSRSLAANYRPVALTSHVIKIFEKVLRNHIVNHMNKNDLFNPNQHGFRSGRSCLSQLLEQHDLILNILDEGLNAAHV